MVDAAFLAASHGVRTNEAARGSRLCQRSDDRLLRAPDIGDQSTGRHVCVALLCEIGNALDWCADDCQVGAIAGSRQRARYLINSPVSDGRFERTASGAKTDNCFGNLSLPKRHADRSAEQTDSHNHCSFELGHNCPFKAGWCLAVVR